MTGVAPLVREPRVDGGSALAAEQAFIAEARQRQRSRRKRNARLILGALVAGGVVFASTLGLLGRTGRTSGPGPGWLPARPTGPMPARVVVWTGRFKIEVLSSRTGRVLRTLATNVGLYQGIPTIAVSRAGVVYFDTARHGREWIESTPLAGGRVTTIGAGYLPAISPNGRLLGYVADAPTRETKSIPEAVVVQNLETGATRTWAFTSSNPAISSMSWSPDSRFLAYTSLYWPSGSRPPTDTTQLLDPRSGGTLTSAPRIPLTRGLAWAGFLTGRVGLAVAPYPAPYPVAQGRPQSLVAVDVRSGRVLRRLIWLPGSGLAVGNAFDGAEGTITADPTGHYVLIAAAGPRGYGEILRWVVGARRLVMLSAGSIAAAWARSPAG